MKRDPQTTDGRLSFTVQEVSPAAAATGYIQLHLGCYNEVHSPNATVETGGKKVSESNEVRVPL